MNLIKKFQDLAPYLLPFSLAFSRTIAEASLLLIVILFLIKSFKEKDFQWLKIGWVRYFLIFIFYLIFLNSPFSFNIKDLFIYSIEFIRWPIFSIALSYWIFTNTKSFEKLFVSILIMLLIFLLLMWYQFIFDPQGLFGLSTNKHGRLTVPFSNNVIPGRIITLFTFILLPIYIFLNKKNNQKSSTFTIFLIIFIGLISTLITGERMSFLIFLSSFIIFLLAIFLDNKKNIYFLIIICSISFISIFLFKELSPTTYERAINSTIEKIINLPNSDYGIVFNTSIEKWKNNFFLGGGLHQFKNINPTQGYGVMEGWVIYHAHNLPLNLLVEIGFIGLILFYLLIFKIIKLNYDRLKARKESFLFVLTLIIFYINFFPLHSHFKLSHNWINALIWFSIGITLAITNFYEKNNKN